MKHIAEAGAVNIFINSERLESRCKRRTDHTEPSSVAVTTLATPRASSPLPNLVSPPIDVRSSPPHASSPCIPSSSFPQLGKQFLRMKVSCSYNAVA